jgi:DNA-binding LacI/PurR family transcriptional regulator
MRDIAEKCGVSRPTVNLILNDRGAGYSADTRRRVLSAARELGYRRNNSARAIQSGRFFGIGLLISAGSELGGVPAGFLTQIEAEAARRGYHLTIGHVPPSNPADAPRLMPKVLTEALVDGLLVYASHELPSELREGILSQPDCPTVWVGEPSKYNAVWHDETKATRLLVDKLVELGHRRIAFVGPIKWTTYSLVARRDAYLARMKELDLPAQLMDFRTPSDGTRRSYQVVVDESDAKFQSTARWLTSEQRPTAVIAFNRDEAMMVQTTAFRIGWSLPRDLSLVTFDDWVVNMHGQPISGALIATTRLGSAAVDMLFRRIETRGNDIPGKAMDSQWVAGRTIGPPPTLPDGACPSGRSNEVTS